ncbi:hypothetical protein LSCM4_01454 [Leishmania orientalis]|uniref:Uncharacterized protein n=1 Tax=Leishmania orientalis TaxID=2249476 RepID=A0A836GM15_9TRYP|nr:hypothetical protein LSCM4_01454 [Leishmania orientalis]
MSARTKAQLEAEVALTRTLFNDFGIDRDAARQRGADPADAEGLQGTPNRGGHRRRDASHPGWQRLPGSVRKYGISKADLGPGNHHWLLDLVRPAYAQETVRRCATKGVTPDAGQQDPISRMLLFPTGTMEVPCLRQLSPCLHLLAPLPPTVAQTVAPSAESAPNIKWKERQETRQSWGMLKRVALPPNLPKILQCKGQPQLPAPPGTTPSPGPDPFASAEKPS